jgi:hypothetical protein
MNRLIAAPAVVAFLLSVLGAAGCVLAITKTPSYEDCAFKHGVPKSSKNIGGSDNSVPTLIICAATTLNDNTGALTAIGTGAIAIFTLTLWLVTGQAVRDSTKQHAISNRAAVYIDGFSYELTVAGDAKDNAIFEHLPPGTDPTLFVTRFAVQPRWKNGGNTPTRRMHIYVDWRAPGETREIGFYRTASSVFFIGPNAIEPSEFLELHGLNALIQNGEAGILGPIPPMLIWGRAEYEDVFGQVHFFDWCYRIRPECHRGERLRVGFVQWGEYNGSDKDS